MGIKKLFDLHKNQDIYIVGTGSSMRVFPQDILKNKIIIGLNQAVSMVKCNYVISIHPDLIINNSAIKNNPDVKWILPKSKTEELLDKDLYNQIHKNVFYFKRNSKRDTSKLNDPSNSDRNLDFLRKNSEFLYVWSSISQTAMNFAKNLGAKNIFLIGCDNTDINGNHHSNKTHVRWNGTTPEYRYNQYYEGCSEVRNELINIGVNVYTITPFLGLSNTQKDFKNLCNINGYETVIPNEDISDGFFFVRKIIDRIYRIFFKSH